jgi:hypothetical protein
MKVYIVSEGCYSDYHIERVFLDKNKAEKYHEIKSKEMHSDVNEIEEYETDDDKQFEVTRYISASLTISPKGNQEYDFNIHVGNSLDNGNELNSYPYYHNSYFDRTGYMYSNEYEIDIHRPILTDHYDEDELRYKYKKVCEDFWTKIKSLKDVEGWRKKAYEKLANITGYEHKPYIMILI